MADASNQTTGEQTEEEKRLAQNTVIQSDSSKSTTERLQDLKTIIINVEQLTKEYKKEGLVIPNAEKFIHDCEAIKKKIDKHNGEEKISHLKYNVAVLENLTAEIYKDDNLASKSFNAFLESCKEFKNQLDQRKKSASKSVCDGCMIDKQKGLIAYSIDKYLESCGNSKCYVNEKKETSETGTKKDAEPETPNIPESPPDVLKNLNSNINIMIELLNTSKAQNTLTPSVEEFLEVCEKFKCKLNSYITDDEKICVCLVCGNVDDKDEARESKINSKVEREVCGHRRHYRPICGSEEFNEFNDSNKCSNKCSEICANAKDQNFIGTQVRKVRKLVRTRNADGTIKEEKETITIDTTDMVATMK